MQLRPHDIQKKCFKPAKYNPDMPQCCNGIQSAHWTVVVQALLCCNVFASLAKEACACARTHSNILSVKVCAMGIKKRHNCLFLVFMSLVFGSTDKAQHVQWSFALPDRVV